MADFRQKSGRGKSASPALPHTVSEWTRGDRPALAFFAAALLLGGAGVAYPLLSWIIFLLALGAIAIVLARHPWPQLPGAAKTGIALACAFWLLLLLQVAPLPQALWAQLPGHAIAADVAKAAGIDAWRAWSLAPGRTLETLLDALPPLAALLLLATASPRRRIAVLRLIVGIAVFNALLGVTQFGAGADTAPIFYGTTHRGVAVGLFVNRNHTAVFLMIAMLLAVLPGVVRLAGREDGPAVQALRSVMVGLLALAVLASLSRSGVFLLPAALLGAALLGRPRQLRVRSLVLAGIGCVAAMAILAQTPPVRALAQRYASAADDARLSYWANTWVAVRDAFPLGTGFGTFSGVYQTFEPLNQISPEFVNRAHNDFLEVLLVAGLPGAALLAAAIGFTGYWIVRARRAAVSRFERRMPLAAALALFLIAGSSVVDYPLHGAAMATIAGALLGLLGKKAAPNAADASSAARYAPKYSAAVRKAVLVLFALWASAVCGSEHWVRAANPDLAAHIQPLNARAWSALADRAQVTGNPATSSHAARKALALDLLDARALRAEGATRLQLGDEAGGAALLSLGGRLGWRDSFTQLWLAEQALAAGAPDFAVQRIDALLRRRVLFDQLVAVLPPLMEQEAGRKALAEQLRYDPGWRISFFNAAARSDRYALADLLALLADLRAGPTPARPDETALIRAALGDAGRFANARQVWLASGGRGNIADPGFEQQANFTVSTGPYVWQATGLTGVNIRAEQALPPRTGRAAALSSSGVASGPALVQTLALAPGRYRVSMTVISRDPDIARRMGLKLQCLGGAAGVAKMPDAGGQAADIQPTDRQLALAWKTSRKDGLVAAARVLVPPGCPGQQFQIAIPFQESGPYSIWIDDAVIDDLP